MVRLSQARVEELRNIRDTDGFRACKVKCESNDVECIAICEGLNYDYYAWEADSIVRELKEKAKPSEGYILEKMQHVAEAFTTRDRDNINARSWDVLNAIRKARGAPEVTVADRERWALKKEQDS